MRAASDFELLLFHRDTETSARFAESSTCGLIVDFEHTGKHQRQMGFDTEINFQDMSDLLALRSAIPASFQSLICRVDGPEPSRDTLAKIADAGANEIILPMVTSVAQIERVCGLVDARLEISVMCETIPALGLVEQVDALAIKRIYIGLTDLWLARKSNSIFDPIADGLVDQIRAGISRAKFGFGGLTLPGYGAPLDDAHLYHALARSEADFTFLRRSFYRDCKGLRPDEALQIIRNRFEQARNRSAEQVSSDHSAACAAIQNLTA